MISGYRPKWCIDFPFFDDSDDYQIHYFLLEAETEEDFYSF